MKFFTVIENAPESQFGGRILSSDSRAGSLIRGIQFVAESKLSKVLRLGAAQGVAVTCNQFFPPKFISDVFIEEGMVIVSDTAVQVAGLDLPNPEAAQTEPPNYLVRICTRICAKKPQNTSSITFMGSALGNPEERKPIAPIILPKQEVAPEAELHEVPRQSGRARIKSADKSVEVRLDGYLDLLYVLTSGDQLMIRFQSLINQPGKVGVLSIDQNGPSLTPLGVSHVREALSLGMGGAVRIIS